MCNANGCQNTAANPVHIPDCFCKTCGMMNHIQKSHILAWRCYEKSMVQRTRTNQLLKEKTVAQSSLPNPSTLDYHHGHEAWIISHSFSRAIQSQPKLRATSQDWLIAMAEVYQGREMVGRDSSTVIAGGLETEAGRLLLRD